MYKCRLKNPYWQEADQLAIYKSAEIQLQYNSQRGT